MDRPVDVTALDSPGGYVEYSAGTPARFYRVGIADPDGNGVGARIELDGVPLRGVLSYRVDVGTRRPTRVTVEFYAASVEAIPRAP